MSRINVQQLPSDAEFLSCFEARPGHSLVYTDFSSLEPHVCAEFSQDPRMLSLYGKGAKPNDIYLYFGANTELFGRQIRQHYDPDNPTQESIDLAKKHCGEIRKILKVMVLGMNYGMGAASLKDDVNTAGFSISKSGAHTVHDDYWQFFAGIKKFKERLFDLYCQNGGYIINGRGRPLPIANKYTRDIVNRFVQSTGHDILIYYLRLLNERRTRERLPMRPWLVDEHDATIWEVPDRHAEAIKQVFLDTYEELNDVLQWGIKFTGKVKIGKNLGIKCD